MHDRVKKKVLGAINYKINSIVYEHYLWVIHKMFSGKSSNPILFHRVTPLGFVTHVYLCVSPTLRAVGNEMK